ncbi:putative metal-dependent ubiquitin isopeptidase [Synechococcus sp. BIOS-E4-1]|uniref:M67 family metallopeptidase n=1 Tax=Synechococcus sp. BIOS-E4-1 TaxID=1400864 RepID=UPI0016487DAE|nr:M67 family metallopeptidase [Synechococcus sp. BIOS-E4-1]QNI53117.1 putative metal-dependent ubiquitin isopeptidase [Synechococcus sp. BIOS-E4-1]
MPCRLRIDLDCLMILRASLKAVSPEEGCALLLGNSAPDPHVHFVWPCCNVWGPGFGGFSDPINADGDRAQISASRRSRFALDPREQIAAQRWSRQRGWRILGSAHSHPGGQPVPSALDRQWAAGEGVVLIDAGTAGVRAWWLQGPRQGAPDRPVSALSMVVHSNATVGDTMNTCPDDAFLPLQ